MELPPIRKHVAHQHWRQSLRPMLSYPWELKDRSEKHATEEHPQINMGWEDGCPGRLLETVPDKSNYGFFAQLTSRPALEDKQVLTRLGGMGKSCEDLVPKSLVLAENGVQTSVGQRWKTMTILPLCISAPGQCQPSAHKALVECALSSCGGKSCMPQWPT